MPDVFTSPDTYQTFIYGLQARFSSIRRARYPYKEKLYWYDSFPHPNDPALAATDSHHKHIPPDIKHHRVPAPDLSFTAPNLPFLIREIEEMLAD